MGDSKAARCVCVEKHVLREEGRWSIQALLNILQEATITKQYSGHRWAAQGDGGSSVAGYAGKHLDTVSITANAVHEASHEIPNTKRWNGTLLKT